MESTCNRALQKNVADLEPPTSSDVAQVLSYEFSNTFQKSYFLEDF